MLGGARGVGTRCGTAVILLSPALLVVALAFSAGGFFPGPTALAAVALSLALLARITLAPRPFAGLSRSYLAGGALLVALAAWTLASGLWSNAPARAVLEYDRVLVYALAFVLVGSLARTEGRVRWVARGVLAALLVVCASALISQTLPELWPTSGGIAPERLSYPLTYWNALGIIAAVGLVLGFALSSDTRESAAGRVVAAGALPVLASTLLLTYSRGAMAASAAGLLAAGVLVRSSGLLSGLLAAVPAAFAVKAAYGAELLSTRAPASEAALAQGRNLAVTVAICTAIAAVARVALLLLDRRLAAVQVPAGLRRRPIRVGAAALVVLGAGAAALALDAPSAIARQYDRFVEGDVVLDRGDVRSRLGQVGNNGRLDHWRVALDESAGHRIRGIGAGTYALAWERARPLPMQVEDAHSLFLEVLAELGIVGLALVAGSLALVLGGFAWRARGPDRGVYAGLFGAGLAWSLHAGIDWDWEMPATGVWLYAAGGLVLAASDRRRDGPAGGLAQLGRVVAGLGMLLVAVLPATVYLSDRPLRQAARAFAAGDCARAVDRSLDSIAMLAIRPEPFGILGYCDVRLGHDDLAVRALENAVARDPRNWEYHYGLALVRAAARRDPRQAARRALALNPRSELARDAVRRFSTNDPDAWRRRALDARLPRDD